MIFFNNDCNFCNRCCPKFIVGPRGLIGPRGPQGQPSNLAGLQVQLVGSSMASIANAENVIFDNLVTVTNSNIIYDDATGVFIVGVAGTYYISWWANIDGAEEGTSLLFSIVTSEGQVISACSMVPVTSLQLNGNALVNFAAPGSFSLKNFSGNTANYGEAVVQASLVIIEVAN